MWMTNSLVWNTDDACLLYNKTIVFDNNSIKHLILLGIESIKWNKLHKIKTSAYITVIFMCINTLKL